ncbi:hypothetical protein Pan216_12380 [Planctomycetes bacterium Pan216]|uniref:Sialidase domain-containing protein n=1 Tax=Kolteria novifilia TaxID=2527975 RepID=A0A518B079_9BACT|nr:hypothetical protein Pan216_12380 [Planctomycetes bacterium Pan216]
MTTDLNQRVKRRTFLLGAGAAALASSGIRPLRAEPGGARDLIDRISQSVIFSGRTAVDGMRARWFHPRGCAIPAKHRPLVLMTLQEISGSDIFGPVHVTDSDDLGETWTQPAPIPGMGRQQLGDGLEMGLCDTVPEYHAPTDTVLALAWNVYYKNKRLHSTEKDRWVVYNVRSRDGQWTPPKRLEWNDPRASRMYGSNCSQRLVLPDGDVLIPMTYAPIGQPYRSVTTVRASFDGKNLQIREVGNELINSAKRGLLEPSVGAFGGRYFMTIRAEDGRGYVSQSKDGLRWKPQVAWAWDDGEPLTMSTTQQHWLAHSDALYLVYTRRDPSNINVMRWRAPIYMAQVDPESLRLIRDTERIVVPMKGDGVNHPKDVARLGNFHPIAITPKESWVTVSETLHHHGWHGDTILARIDWARPNQMVTPTT